MLSDEDLGKLCHGLIVYADIPTSSGRRALTPHNCVILNSDAEINESWLLTVAAISSDKHDIDTTFRVPVPSRTGLRGFICCSWLHQLLETQIIKITGPKLSLVEMSSVLRTVRDYRAWLSTKGQ